MLKKYLLYVIAVLALLIGLNYYFSYSSARNIEQQLTKVSNNVSDSTTFQSGNVTIYPFKGDVLLNNLSYEDIPKSLYGRSSDILLDLTYFDFLKIYFLGSESALNHINNARIVIGSINFGEAGQPQSGVSTAETTVSLEGNLLMFLQAALTRQMPTSDLSVKTVVEDIQYKDATDKQLLAENARIYSTYNADSGVARIDSIVTNGGALSTHFQRSINYNTHPDKLSRWEKFHFSTHFSYQYPSPSLLKISSNYGELSANYLSINAEMASLAYFKKWFDSIINLQGDFEVNVKNIQFSPSNTLEDQYGFFINFLREDTQNVLFDNFKLTGNSMPEFLMIENMVLTHALFDLSFKGRIIKNTADFKASVIQDGQITIFNLQPGMKNLLINAVSLFGLRIPADSEKITIPISGTLNKPKFGLK